MLASSCCKSAALHPNDDYRGANLNAFGQMADICGIHLLQQLCTRAAQMPAREVKRCTHLDDFSDGRRGVVATGSVVVEQQHPELKVRDLAFVCEAVVGCHQVDLAQWCIHNAACSNMHSPVRSNIFHDLESE